MNVDEYEVELKVLKNGCPILYLQPELLFDKYAVAKLDGFVMLLRHLIGCASGER